MKQDSHLESLETTALDAYNAIFKLLKAEHPKEAEKSPQKHPPAASISEDDFEIFLQNSASNGECIPPIFHISYLGCDMFNSHFNPDSALKSIRYVQNGGWTTSTHQDPELGCIYSSFPSGTEPLPLPVLKRPSDFQNIKMKKRLVQSISRNSMFRESFSPIQQSLAPSLFSYRDFLLTSRTHVNAPDIRTITIAHVLNHIYKTRSSIIKNNARLSASDPQTLEFKDQGFTRPKVLIILPTRNSCLQYVNDLILLSETEQQEKKKRFVESFSIEKEVIPETKPTDFRELFAGNSDDSFRIGIKFTRKTMKLFSDFYSSDIILASPQGLSLAIQGSRKIRGDFDFLSSIELLVFEHADALLMQNWAHVQLILENINKIPSQSRDCDFSRIKEWYLDGNAKYMRQTIVYSSYLTPELNSLYSSHMLNYEGKAKNKVFYNGSINDVRLPIVQTFLRFGAQSSQSEADIRFEHFRNVILKPLLQSCDYTGTFVFIPSYFDFVRLKDHLESIGASFCSVSEDTPSNDIPRLASYFQTGRKSIMLYTERFHHFRRLQIRGVKNIIMYGMPDHGNFYPEVVRFLGTTGGTCRVLFNKWDAIELERIVGSKRIKVLCDTSKGDIFKFT